MTDFEVDGQTYRIEQADPFEQLNVARRLMPLQVALGLSMTKIAEGMQASEAALLEFMAGPISEVVSKMPQADFDYVMKSACRHARRQQGDRWALVMTGDNLMFKDLSMKALLRIIIEFVKANLGGFFGGLDGVMS